jgi:hypothetical protein
MEDMKPKDKAWKQCKDWERHARVLSLMQKRRVTLTAMSGIIKERIQHVSACVWGIYGRNNPRIEAKIAEFLETDRDKLFDSRNSE